MKHVFVSSTFKDMQFERDALHMVADNNVNGVSFSEIGKFAFECQFYRT